MTDDLIANLRPETFEKLDASLHNPLRAALNAARAANIENFDLDEFVDGLGGIANISRGKIYSATAEIKIKHQKKNTENTDGDKATDPQKRTIERFGLNPANFPTKGEASAIISALIEKIESRRNAASNSSPAANTRAPPTPAARASA